MDSSIGYLERSPYISTREEEPGIIDVLRIVVHPFYKNVLPFGSALASDPEYRDDQIALKEAILNRALPQSPSSLTLIMPNVDRKDDGTLNMANLRRHIRSIRTLQEHYPALPNWQSLYRTLKKQSAYPQNILFIGDLFSPSFRHEQDIQVAKSLKLWLQQQGHLISSSTRLILCGEELDMCLAATGDLLLEAFEDIDAFFIDKSASSPHYPGSKPITESQRQFYPWTYYRRTHTPVTETADFIRVGKTNN